jgi:hypothetical protein
MGSALQLPDPRLIGGQMMKKKIKNGRRSSQGTLVHDQVPNKPSHLQLRYSVPNCTGGVVMSALLIGCMGKSPWMLRARS